MNHHILLDNLLSHALVESPKADQNHAQKQLDFRDFPTLPPDSGMSSLTLRLSIQAFLSFSQRTEDAPAFQISDRTIIHFLFLLLSST